MPETCHIKQAVIRNIATQKELNQDRDAAPVSQQEESKQKKNIFNTSVQHEIIKSQFLTRASN